MANLKSGYKKGRISGIYAAFGGLLGSLQLLLRPGIEPGPHWPKANALTTTLKWRLTSSLCGEQAAPQGSMSVVL